MADLLLIHAPCDAGKAAVAAAAAEADGHRAGVASREAACVIALWSRRGRESLRLRGQANEALDAGKLIQLSLDGSVPPPPFETAPWTDLSHWAGSAEAEPWPGVRRQIELAVGVGVLAEGERRSGGGNIPFHERGERALQGFEKWAAVSWMALSVAAAVALAVLLVARGLISADAFRGIAIAALLAAVLTSVVGLTFTLRMLRADRR